MLEIGVDETLDIELVADGASSSSRTTAVRPRLIRTRPPLLEPKECQSGVGVSGPFSWSSHPQPYSDNSIHSTLPYSCMSLLSFNSTLFDIV
jgi:hypothetical protein